MPGTILSAWDTEDMTRICVKDPSMSTKKKH